jgi:hypothetical protein
MDQTEIDDVNPEFGVDEPPEAFADLGIENWDKHRRAPFSWNAKWIPSARALFFALAQTPRDEPAPPLVRGRSSPDVGDALILCAVAEFAVDGEMLID